MRVHTMEHLQAESGVWRAALVDAQGGTREGAGGGGRQRLGDGVRCRARDAGGVRRVCTRAAPSLNWWVEGVGGVSASTAVT